jgi:hypothetical protein
VRKKANACSPRNQAFGDGVVLGWVSALDCDGRTIWIVDAHRDDGRRFIAHADEMLTAFVELERQALTVTFYLESIRAGDDDGN